MKYGHEYSQALASEDFPAHWVSSAISYRDLKKSIKKVQKELLDLGLDATTLKRLTSSIEVRRSSGAPAHDARFAHFSPELWIATDGKTGQFLDAGLTAKTKAFLDDPTSASRSVSVARSDDLNTSRAGYIEASDKTDELARSDVKWTQVPLSAMTKFFDSLDPKLAQLEVLQESEAHRLENSIVQLGQDVQALTEPVASKASKYKAQADVETWRQLFALYIESAVFFSSYEQDHGSRDYAKAKQQLELFSNTLVKRNLVNNFKRPQSKLAFDRFVTINLDILRVIRFQEINSMAVRKILKKFDKRTALGVGQSYQSTSPGGPFARSIAKDMCCQVSSKVVSIVPQLDDFICPICYSLAWRPIRLGCCNSVFCIRCIIQLQRETKDKCPMCRQPTVMLADQTHIDEKTAKYLMRYFPKEVKERQRANERAAGVDKYGESFYKNGCSVM